MSPFWRRNSRTRLRVLELWIITIWCLLELTTIVGRRSFLSMIICQWEASLHSYMSVSTSDEVTSTSTPLLPEIRPEVGGGGERRGSSDSYSATAVLVLSAVVAVSGSYVFGSAVGFSSPAQPGIVDDLGLTVAEVAITVSRKIGS